eukprot:871271-Rhodomonas_salina.1
MLLLDDEGGRRVRSVGSFMLELCVLLRQRRPATFLLRLSRVLPINLCSASPNPQRRGQHASRRCRACMKISGREGSGGREGRRTWEVGLGRLAFQVNIELRVPLNPKQRTKLEEINLPALVLVHAVHHVLQRLPRGLRHGIVVERTYRNAEMRAATLSE